MFVSEEVAEILNSAFSLAKSARYEFVTPELLREMTIACEEMAREDDRRNGRISEAGDRSENEGDADDSAQDHLWRQYAVCLNDNLEGVNPLIGREEEAGAVRRCEGQETGEAKGDQRGIWRKRDRAGDTKRDQAAFGG